MLKEEMRFYEKEKAKHIEIEKNNKTANKFFWFMIAIVFIPIFTIVTIYF